ncbi:group II intron reverse transcriptase/maturase [bacterium]
MSNSEKIMSQVKTLRYKWDTIPWSKLERKVSKLQNRIYRASKEGDIARVRKLERLLLTSTNAKLLAVRKVTQINKGKRTAGVDGKANLSKKQRIKTAMEITMKATTKPLRRVWIPKQGKETFRPLGIPTIMDRAKQTLVKMALEPEWEAKFDPNQYGFRPKRSCHDAIEGIFCAINMKNAYVLDADISGCFDNIDHEVLLRKLNISPKVRKLVKVWLKAGVIDNNVFAVTESGTPQGGTISPMLANVALCGLESDIKKALIEDLFQFLKLKRKKMLEEQIVPSKWNATREQAAKGLSIIIYADDFVVIHESLEIILKAKEYIATWLKNIGLELNKGKTRICHTYLRYGDNNVPGFDFLGFNIRQYEDKHKELGYTTLIKPNKESIKRHLYKIAKTIDKHRWGNQYILIKALNPIIRGWCEYYRYSVASKIFSSTEYEVMNKIFRWIHRKHSNKNGKWKKNKYFQVDARSKWRFRIPDKIGLVRHSAYQIMRYIKVRGNKSPFDGDCVYWKNREKRSYVAA